jgi:hypothetical protein
VAYTLVPGMPADLSCPVMAVARAIMVVPVVRRLHRRPVKGCSSTGRAAVSKTAGCRFKSCRPCVGLNLAKTQPGEAEDN